MIYRSENIGVTKGSLICLHCRAASPDRAASRLGSQPRFGGGVDEFGWLLPRKWAQKTSYKGEITPIYMVKFLNQILNIVLPDTIIYKDAIDMIIILQKFILLHVNKLIFNEIVKIDFDLMILLIRISHI